MRRIGALVALVLCTAALSGCFHQQAPGSAFRQFLSSSTHDKMIVEIDHQNGKELRGTTVDLLRTRIGERLNKPGGVTYEQKGITVSQEVWTLDELRAAESDHRNHRSVLGTAAMYVLVVGGGYEGDNANEKVLGVAYSPTSVAIFKDSIESSRPGGVVPLFSAADVERSVMVHEFGHLLGLVNLGLPMVQPHEDPEKRGHSSNSASVMYWAVESSLVAQVLNGPPPTQFDANDIADMRAAGGK